MRTKKYALDFVNSSCNFAENISQADFLNFALSFYFWRKQTSLKIISCKPPKISHFQIPKNSKKLNKISAWLTIPVHDLNRLHKKSEQINSVQNKKRVCDINTYHLTWQLKKIGKKKSNFLNPEDWQAFCLDNFNWHKPVVKLSLVLQRRKKRQNFAIIRKSKV